MASQISFKDPFSNAVREEGYFGRLELEDLNDPPREMLRDLHQIVNDALQKQQTCIYVGNDGDQHPTFDVAGRTARLSETAEPDVGFRYAP